MKKNFLLSLVILFLFSISLYGQQNEVSEKQLEKLYPTKDIVTRYHNTWTEKHYRSRIHSFKKDPLQKGDIVFIGNSITEQGRDWSERFGIERIRNRGIAGDVSSGVMARLDELVFFEPKAVFILIGINDLYNMHHELETRESIQYDKIIPSAEFIGKNILKIARKLHRKLPDTKIYVRTIMPTRREFLKEEILLINSILKQQQEEDVFTLIDFYQLFVDEEGRLKKELTKDGLHLNEAGYQEWVEFERAILIDL